MNGLLKVQDTKKPNREPFDISPEGLAGLQKRYGNRYRPLEQVIVTPDKIEVTKKDFPTPAKGTKGK